MGKTLAAIGTETTTYGWRDHHLIPGAKLAYPFAHLFHHPGKLMPHDNRKGNVVPFPTVRFIISETYTTGPNTHQSHPLLGFGSGNFSNGNLPHLF
jgi:hypothetical protein